MGQYKILDGIQTADDIKDLTPLEINALCTELRQFIIENVSQTGGHLSSNLGVVELSVALEKVFDSQKDRIVFDVGHQSYVHKILTGRKEQFSTLRKYGGISGFTKPEESECDASVSGHASISVSTALGMAHARTLQKQEYQVVAVIGDGALTGGMAYEALSDAGTSKEPVIIILNDNNMSIAKNVGAMSKHLANLRMSPRYLRVKKRVKGFLEYSYIGTKLSDFITKIKSGVKSVLLPSSFFENMGLAYLGPADGHDVQAVCELLEMAKSLQKPVIVHLMTQKGRGYSYSEQSPDRYHGVSPFDIKTGSPLKSPGKTFSEVFGQTLLTLADIDPKICAVTAAMQSGTGLSAFSKLFPKRFFDVGIAEEHAVTMSAGMAKRGLMPVCAIYSTFLQRSFDQLIHDVAIDHIKLLLAVDRAGIVGDDGPTHNGVFDVGYLRQVPGIAVFAPSNFRELRSMISAAIYRTDGPAAVRFPRGGEGKFVKDTSEFSICILSQGRDITLVSYGIMINESIDAAVTLKDHGISVELVKINRLDCFAMETIQASVKKTGRIIVVEDVVHQGGIGQYVLEHLAGEKLVYYKLCNTGDRFLPHGDVQSIYRYCGIDSESIAAAGMEAMKF